MEGQEEPPPRAQDPAYLSQRPPQPGRREMDNGVESNHPSQGSVGQWQCQHVPQLELKTGVPPPGLAQQLPRQIQPAHADAAAVEESSRLPGAAPKVINLPAATDLGRKAAQQLPVQGLVREFASEAVRVLPRDRVVTSPDVIGRLLHWMHRR